MSWRRAGWCAAWAAWLGTTVLAVVIACAPTKTFVVEGGKAVVLCVKQDQQQLGQLGLQLGAAAVRSLLLGQSIDWPALGTQAEAAGLELGACALAQFRASVNGPALSASARVEVRGDAAGREVERLRAKLDGATIRTSLGDL